MADVPLAQYATGQLAVGRLCAGCAVRIEQAPRYSGAHGAPYLYRGCAASAGCHGSTGGRAAVRRVCRAHQASTTIFPVRMAHPAYIADVPLARDATAQPAVARLCVGCAVRTEQVPRYSGALGAPMPACRRGATSAWPTADRPPARFDHRRTRTGLAGRSGRKRPGRC